ncbi:MAG TPA: potassium transporter Kef [Gammaproteobacteria bacterium]|nr:potassium transporter Kef [Gammaproteobacteria bacterium]
MELSWISETLTDTIWIALAFLLGLAARHVGLPPMVGFLAAGFLLQGLGAEGGETLATVADFGITLLLFSIGLKLNIRTLWRPEIWGTASLHMGLTVAVFSALFLAFGILGVATFGGLDLRTAALLAFAFSFSSTVFAVKILEEKGELSSRYGRIAIGILIMQDIFAVVFLAASTGKMPSLWALALFALIPLRHVLTRVLEEVGHGELFILYGLLLAVGGAAVFEIVDLKADLGALVFGMLVAQHPRSAELAKSLLSLKDLLLIGFFLNIGISAAPTLESLGIAVLLGVLIPFKIALFFFLLVLLRCRARNAFLAALALANYSEFGLIVSAMSHENGWLSSEWLAAIAIAVAISFALAAPLNNAAHDLYERYKHLLRRFENKAASREIMPIDTGDTEILIFGMGRVGTGAYETMRRHHGDRVLGIDHDAETVSAHRRAGRNVILGDAMDKDFWETMRPDNIKLVMLGMPNHVENMHAIAQLRKNCFRGKITATAKYDDQTEELLQAGAHAAYNIYAEAGAGFAEHVRQQLGSDISTRKP